MKVSVPLDLAGMESRPSTIFHNGWILVGERSQRLLYIIPLECEGGA